MTGIDFEHETMLAVRAAIEGGRIAHDFAAKLNVRTKESARDVVTAADLAVQRHVFEVLAASKYGAVGEEDIGQKAAPSSADAPVWMVDPIDGTANYVAGLGLYATSVGLCRGIEFLLGAVCVPTERELFCTLGQNRALLNGKTITHEHRAPDASLVAASFSSAAGQPGARQAQYNVFGAINDRTRGCLRLGSAAVNICFTAAGRLQAAYGTQAPLWDVAGALAVAIRAGCRCVVAPSAAPGRVDYAVGSRDTVEMIRELCVQNGLMGEPCQVY
jgi:myo-inositol-1(or 4)-monophosphatase